MRIAYLINGLNGGGAAFPMTQVIGLMRELGHDVMVFAMLPQDGKAARRLQADNIPYEVLGSSVYDIVAPAVRLRRRLRAWQPDLLWTSLTRGTVYGQLAGRALGIPVVSWQHSAYLKPGNVRLLRTLAPLTALWVADSQAVSTFAIEALRLDAKRMRVWSPFVASSDAPTSRPRQPGEPIRFGTLGRLHVSKQYDTLIKAFARLRDLDPELATQVELHIGGDGPEERALRALSHRLGLDGSVHFAGFVQRPAMFLASLHAYVQTSRKEGFCIAAHEAMQAGLPVIATAVGELRHSVRPGITGWLCEVGDIEGIARAMLQVVRIPGEAARIGQHAHDQVLQAYSTAAFRAAGERLLAEAQELVARHRAARVRGGLLRDGECS